MKRLVLFMVVLVLSMSVFVVSAQDDTIADIVTAATEADEAEFTLLSQLVTITGSGELLADEDAELTVFAPTDEAFLALMEASELAPADLMADPDLIANILLYHVVEEILFAEDIEDGDEVEAANGAVLTFAVDDDGEVTINELALIVTADIEASNGVIHVIDAVLVPPAGEACVISTDSADTARVRVGPGENRTSVSFLAAGQDFVVLGSFEDDAGGIWYQLDKEEAAPGRAINEAWVAASDVDSTGDCENIAEADAPPIIPITSSVPATTNDEGGDDGVAPPPVTASGDVTIWIDYAPWAAQLPANLQASSRGSATYIVTAYDELINEEVCGTYYYANDPSRTTTVRRYQRAVSVTVLSQSGAVLREQQFVGGAAPGCPSNMAVNATLNGDLPGLGDALAFILGQ